jgi:hypothetical protein
MNMIYSEYDYVDPNTFFEETVIISHVKSRENNINKKFLSLYVDDRASNINDENWIKDETRIVIFSDLGMPPKFSPQVWKIIFYQQTSSGTREYIIVNVYSGKLLSINSLSQNDGMVAIQYRKQINFREIASFQRWTFEGFCLRDNSSVFLIKNVNSGKYLGTQSRFTLDNTDCIQFSDQTSLDNYQFWKFLYPQFDTP